MAESSGGGELGIGLRDIKNAGQRLKGPDGLNEQIKFNQHQLKLRVVGGLFTLLIMSCFFSWFFWMPEFVRWGATALTLISFLIYLLIYIRQKNRIARIREAQLKEHRETKEGKV
ncbi:hypothetical protein ACMXYX_11135 [Neptuniibacter sp. QD72_48]|uniref:hypothetical protein n=1 Tax=unclassified Neptuniibacter TaxID=2630693 RepID=UPI0039F70B76